MIGLGEMVLEGKVDPTPGESIGRPTREHGVGFPGARLASVKWLVTSIVLSVGLTMLLNAFSRSRPDLSNRAADWLSEQTARQTTDDDGRRVRVYAPWRAMLLGSLILTVVLNLLIRLV